MESNAKLAKNNIFSGVIKVFITVLFPFILRTVIIYTLGMNYLGLNSLFSSILSVLNLAELGFSSAIIYSMYEPLAHNNTQKVCALLAYYKKIYSIIGLVVLVSGCVILPNVTYLIKGECPDDINIYILFIIYLFNTSVSYFFYAYKSALLNALKRLDLVNKIQTIVFLVQYLVQIVLLLTFHNYYVYIVVMPICTVLANFLIARTSKKQFPEFRCEGQLSKGERNIIKSSVKSILLYRISEVTRNSLDTIVLSAFYGLTITAIYNNYYYVFTSVYSLLVAVNQSLQAIVGQNLVKKNTEENLENMHIYNFGIMWIVSWFTVCLICLYQPFMRIWVGESNVLSIVNAILFAVYFYVLNMNNIKNLYFDGCGLWSRGWWTFVFEIIGNLVLNIVLGKIFGVTGIIVATIITIFIFSFVCRTQILFKVFFKRSEKKFISENVLYFLTMLIISLVTFAVCGIFNYMTNFQQLIVRGLISLVLPNIMLFLVFRRNHYFSYLRNQLLGWIRSRSD